MEASADVGDPQSFNRYTYVLNNPVNFTDPSGLMTMVDASMNYGEVGNGAFKDALPVLEEILRDPTEEDYIRSDALRAIYMLDSFLGEAFAKDYLAQDGPLAIVSRDILKGDAYLKERRSHSKALTSNHE